MNKTEQLWSGEFGDAYLARNRVNWRSRMRFWGHIMELTGARSVYEVGTSAGWNLSAIRRICPDVELYGHDINEHAVYQAQSAGLDVGHTEAIRCSDIELVFTAGVLIHIPPEKLEFMMKEIIRASCDYVLAIEYASDKEEEVTYRGHSGMLWKRPYGELYQALGLKLVETGDAGEGFDNCQYWLLLK